MLIELLLFVAGILLVVKGSDYFVDASVAIAVRARLPRVVIGGTLVSLATTTPELTVSVISGVQNVPGLAIGNALGSVAANIGFILALVAIIRTIELHPAVFRWRSQVMLGLVVFLFLLTLDLNLPQWRGAVLVLVGLVYLFVNYRRGRRARPDGDVTPEVKFKSRRQIALFFILGLAMVVVGSLLLVDSGTAIAVTLGVRPIFVGLTMVAVGTSLPELATAISAVRKRVADLSVGNLIGANVLNLTLVTGTAAAISPLELTRSTQLYTFPAAFTILVVFYIASRRGNRITRGEGVVLMVTYIGFIAGLAVLHLQ